MYGSSWFYDQHAGGGATTTAVANYGAGANNYGGQGGGRPASQPMVPFPTIQEQVELCRRIAGQLVDEENARSKGTHTHLSLSQLLARSS